MSNLLMENIVDLEKILLNTNAPVEEDYIQLHEKKPP